MNFNKILETLSNKLPDILLAIVILIVFWIMSKVLKRMVYKVLHSKSHNSNISLVLSNILKNVVLIFGFITSLGTIGINVSAIIAGLGLTGFAVGFALKDMLSNFISGTMIFIYEPFKVDDFIEVEGKEGKVVDINLRYVTIETETQKILVPNSISVSKVIVVNK